MNMQALLKQAQKMQKDVAEAEAKLNGKEYETTMGGGAIRIVASGSMEIKEIQIEESLLDKEGKEDLEQMLKSAMNDILNKITTDKETTMNSLTGGVKMPGTF